MWFCRAEENLVVNNKDNRVFRTIECLGPIGLVVAPWKFDVLKTNIWPRNFASRANICFKNIKFPRGNYQTDSSSTETLHCLNSVQWLSESDYNICISILVEFY